MKTLIISTALVCSLSSAAFAKGVALDDKIPTDNVTVTISAERVQKLTHPSGEKQILVYMPKVIFTPAVMSTGGATLSEIPFLDNYSYKVESSEQGQSGTWSAETLDSNELPALCRSFGGTKVYGTRLKRLDVTTEAARFDGDKITFKPYVAATTEYDRKLRDGSTEHRKVTHYVVILESITCSVN